MFLGGLLDPEAHPGIDFILASVKIDYLKEMHYPGTVEVGTRMFRDGAAVATAVSVNIFLDTETRQTAPISEDIRAVLEADSMQAGR